MGKAAQKNETSDIEGKVGAFYKAFMDETRVEALDAEPIAPFLQRIRAAVTSEELVDLMGSGRESFFSSLFGLGVGPDDKAPTRYAVSVRQGGLGLNRDYYVTPRLAEKKAAYQRISPTWGSSWE